MQNEDIQKYKLLQVWHREQKLKENKVRNLSKLCTTTGSKLLGLLSKDNLACTSCNSSSMFKPLITHTNLAAEYLTKEFKVELS
jgi:hypothetical protein